MISIKHLKKTVRQSKITPYFLEQEDEENKEKILELVKYYGSLVGKRYSEFSEEKVIEIIGDYKLARAFQSVLNNFYSFKTTPFNEAVSLDNETIKSYSDLRLFIFSLSEKGFCQSAEEKEKVYEKANPKLGTSIDFDNVLWLDHPDNRILRKEKEFDINNFIRLYNSEVLNSLFLNSVEVSFKLKRFDKGIFWVCKQNRLLFDISKDGLSYTLKVFGPVELFGKPTKYGYLIANAVPKLMKYAEELSALLEIKNRRLSFFTNAEEYYTLTKGAETIEAEERLTTESVKEGESDSFDSSPEQRFYESFKSIDNHGWELIREPEPVIRDNTIFLPDFALKREGSYVFLEIIGFWTEQYVAKKLDKLSKLKGLNLILLVNDSYNEETKKNLENLKLPTAFFNSSDAMPVLKVLKIVEEKFSDFEARFEEKTTTETTEDVISKVKESLDVNGFIICEDLKKIFSSYSSEEFEKYLSFYKEKFNPAWVYVPGVGVFTTQKLESFKKVLALCVGKDRGFLKKECPEIPDTLIRSLGYSIRWKSLNETEIVKEQDPFMKLKNISEENLVIL